MSKCYYCGSEGRGCPECRNRVIEARTPIDQVVDPTLYAAQDHALQSQGKGELSPEEVKMTWDEAVHWVAECQDHLNRLVRSPSQAIRLELLHTPSHPMMIISRTVYEDEPEATRNRKQQWSLEKALHAEGQNTPLKMAKYIVFFWACRRACAAKKRAAATTTARVAEASDFKVQGSIEAHFPLTPELKDWAVNYRELERATAAQHKAWAEGSWDVKTYANNDPTKD